MTGDIYLHSTLVSPVQSSAPGLPPLLSAVTTVCRVTDKASIIRASCRNSLEVEHVTLIMSRINSLLRPLHYSSLARQKSKFWLSKFRFDFGGFKEIELYCDLGVRTLTFAS